MARNDLVENAGRFVGRHAMVWTRGFDVPVEQVWEAISTKDGLDKWWIIPVEIDLRVAGTVRSMISRRISRARRSNIPSRIGHGSMRTT